MEDDGGRLSRLGWSPLVFPEKNLYCLENSQLSYVPSSAESVLLTYF